MPSNPQDLPTFSERTRRLIAAAADEDLAGRGDLTSALLPHPERETAAALVTRVAGVVCGLSLATAICEEFSRRLDVTLSWRPEVADGTTVEPGQRVAELRGPIAAVLTAERTLLNFVGRMSGVATLTRRFVEAARAANPDVLVLDTRKTLPGWRELDRYAVRCGGGMNHRDGLYDAVLLKDNHLAGIPSERLSAGLSELLERVPAGAKFVEVEVDTLDQFDQVLKVVGVDIVLLDNFTPDALREAVKRRDAVGLRNRVALEASGGIDLTTIVDIAATDVDRISVGALTHSAVNLDLGLDLLEIPDN